MTGEDAEELARIRRIEKLQPNGRWWPVTFLLDLFDRRVSELLDANSKLVSERRVAQGRALHFEMAMDFLLRSNGMRQIRELEAQVRQLTAERDAAVREAKTAWIEAERFLVEAQRAKVDQCD
jgi:hypothetical protein